MPSWTTTEKVSALLGNVSITTTSEPTTAQVLDWIREASVWIDKKLLGNYSALNEYIDTDGTEFLFPRYYPIIGVSSLSVVDSDLDEAESLTALTQGPNVSGSSYMIMKDNISGMDLGYCIKFYADIPSAREAKVKISYSYGFNVDEAILSKYATEKVAMRILESWSANDQMNINLETGNWGSLYKALKQSTEEAEAEFPSEPIIGMGSLRSPAKSFTALKSDTSLM